MQPSISRNIVFALLIMLFAFISCEQMEKPAQSGVEVTRAVAVLHPTEGSTVNGVVWFTETEAGIKIEAQVEGLEPGEHGFHIHEFGDCSSADGKSAGGHFNPEAVPHAGPEAAKRHVGDLGNLQADENGVAHYERVDTVISFSGAHSIIGRGVIVHAKADDLSSQPTGAAGARIACGVIGIAKGAGE